MAVNSRFFGGGSYSSVDLAAVLKRFLGNGYRQGVNNELACYASGADLNVRTKTGEAFVNGYWVENTAEIVTAIVPDATLPRYDRMVLHLDTATPSITIIAVTGTADAAPVAPALTRSGTVYEQPLCLIYVPAAAGSIDAANVYDEREPSDAAGPLMAWLTNNSGVARSLGEVVVVSTAADMAFTTTTSLRNQSVIGVVADLSVANAAVGRVLTHGVGLVLSDAAVTRGQWLVSSNTAGKATPKTNREYGSFALALATTAGAGLVLALLTGSPVAGIHTATAYMPAAYDNNLRVADSDLLGGYPPNYYLEAGSLATGEIDLARIPATLTGKDADTLDTYHAADLLGGGVILGAIMMWSGTLGGTDGHRPMVGGVANENWHLCNGDLVGAVQTPDLRGKFIIGAGGTYNVGDTGGAATANLPNHLHTADGTLGTAHHAHLMPHTHFVPVVQQQVQSGTGIYVIGSISASTTEQPSIASTEDKTGLDVSGNTSNPTTTPTIATLPPYQGVFFIMKIA